MRIVEPMSSNVSSKSSNDVASFKLPIVLIFLKESNRKYVVAKVCGN